MKDLNKVSRIDIDKLRLYPLHHDNFNANRMRIHNALPRNIHDNSTELVSLYLKQRCLTSSILPWLSNAYRAVMCHRSLLKPS